MGRELQKKKNRSSLPKVKRKPKSKKLNVRGNAIIAANWDQSLTLSQNYRRLGLTSKLNAATGGTEKPSSAALSSNPSAPQKDAFSIKSKLPTNLIPTEARIERDPKTGAILRVIHSEIKRVENPLNDPLNELSDNEPGTVVADGKTHASTEIVRQLEEQALLEAPKKPRQQSKREEEWIANLVATYGEDYRRMVRDRKLNPMQQSEGDLRRRIRRWKERQRTD
ncbi:Nucleolar protein 16 [Acarospora aff. strigata]|nr:Nucleolar protein 16 [Acarospora aff. strigata]